MSTAPQDTPSSTAQQRLLEAALDLFSRKGYAATSVRELVEAAGVTKPVLYYYFKNKEGLYLTLVQNGLAEFHRTAELSKALPGTVQQRITGYCTSILDIFVARLDIARLIYAIYYGPPQGAPAVDFDASFTTLLKDVAELLQEGIAAGELPPLQLEDAAWAVVSLLNTAMEEQLCHADRPRTNRDSLQRMLAMLFKGICHE